MEDRKRALVSRLLQYALVHEVLGIPFDGIVIKRTPEGKPYLVCVYAFVLWSYVIIIWRHCDNDNLVLSDENLRVYLIMSIDYEINFNLDK